MRSNTEFCYGTAGRSSALKDMGYTMTEMEDYLSYVGDVIEVATPRLRSEVSRKFWDGFVEPVVIVPLIASQVRATVLISVPLLALITTESDDLCMASTLLKNIPCRPRNSHKSVATVLE